MGYGFKLLPNSVRDKDAGPAEHDYVLKWIFGGAAGVALIGAIAIGTLDLRSRPDVVVFRDNTDLPDPPGTDIDFKYRIQQTIRGKELKGETEGQILEFLEDFEREETDLIKVDLIRQVRNSYKNQLDSNSLHVPRP